MNKEVIKAINTCKWLSFSERRIMIGLWSFWSKSKKIYASYRYFSENWSMSYSTVKRGIAKLNNYKIIEVDSRKGSTNLIRFNISSEELIDFLGQKEKPLEIQNDAHTDKIDLSENQSDLSEGQNELTNSQNELGSEVKMSHHNTEDYTDVNKESNTDLYNDVNNEILNDDSNSLNNFHSDDGAEHFPSIGELQFAEFISNEMLELQRLQDNVGNSNISDIVLQFNTVTGKTLVMYDEGDLHNPQRFWILGETSKIAQQSKFNKDKYMVVNPNFTKEIVSHYE